MKTLLIDKDPKVESAVAVRRAISLLAQLGTPDAIGLLKNLAEQDPKRDVGRIRHRRRSKGSRSITLIDGGYRQNLE